MTRGVSVRRPKPSREYTGAAHCQDCHRLPVDCTRERARQHVRDRGHTVLYTVARITIYEPEKTP